MQHHTAIKNEPINLHGNASIIFSFSLLYVKIVQPLGRNLWSGRYNLSKFKTFKIYMPSDLATLHPDTNPTEILANMWKPITGTLFVRARTWKPNCLLKRN